MAEITPNPQDVVKKIEKLPMYTFFCQKVIPLAFDESLSYLETLYAFQYFLNNTVIPTVNNNAEAVTELQGLYEELNTYVTDYFTNLDVQEEINKKLDNMAQDGSLTNLIKGYVDPLIEEQNEDIESFENMVRATINNFDTRLSAVASGTPLFVDDISKMTDTTKAYVLTTDGYVYTYSNGGWTQQFVYLADDPEVEEAKDLVFKKVVNNKLVLDYLYLLKGGSIVSSTGQYVNNAARCRTNQMNTTLVDIVEMTDSNYQFFVVYYTSSSAYISGGSFTNKIIVNKNNAKFALAFKRVDGAEITDEDIVAIKSGIAFKSYTDITLKNQSVSADSLNTGLAFDSIMSNKAVIPYDFKTRTTLNKNSGMNFVNGNYADFTGYARTGRLKVANRCQMINFNNPDYTLYLFHYSSDLGDWDKSYLGCEKVGSNVTNYYNKGLYTSMLFYKNDGTSMTDEDLEEIRNSIECFVELPLDIKGEYLRFNITSNSHIQENEEDDTYTENDVKCILRMPPSYSQTGKKTPIICLNHGAGESVTDSSWWGTSANTFINYLLNQGFAVFGVNRVNESEDSFGKTYGSPIALENIHKAFEYIKFRYNVEDKMFIHGSSMGGATAIIYPYVYPEDVKAVTCFAPANTLYSMWRTNNGALRSETSGDSIAQCFGYSSRQGAKDDGYERMIGYMPMLKIQRYNRTTGSYIMSDILTIENGIETSATNSFWHNNNENWVIPDYPVPIKCWCGLQDITVENSATNCLIEAIRNGGGVAYIKNINGTHSSITFGQEPNMKEEIVIFMNRYN